MPPLMQRTAQALCGLRCPGFMTPRKHLASTISPTSVCSPRSIAGPAIIPGPEADPVGAAFLVEEALVGPGGGDLNGDGDSGDIVVRTFRM